MKKITKLGAQGELLLRRIKALPADAESVAANDGRYIVGHSETGHHHIVDATGAKLYQGNDPLVAYLVAESAQFDLTHLRSFDTHQTLRCVGEPGAVWEVRRQEEWTPEGWRRVVD